MYNLPHFKAAEKKEVIEFMYAHPFITLCGCDANNHPVATHVPVLFEERNGTIFLQAHVMRKQKHTEAFQKNPNVLAVFSGEHSYVSASWYIKKNVASTWNYQAVHASGILRWMNENFLHNLLIKLTEKFENNPQSPALVQRMDRSYVSELMKAIVAFEIEITSVEHVFKLSQNHGEKNYESVIQNLEQLGGNSQTIAEKMKNKQQQLFKFKKSV